MKHLQQRDEAAQEETSTPAVYEILEAPPFWIVRHGMLLIGSVVTVLLALGFLIRYPDVIKTSFVLTSSFPPQKIVSNTVGRINILVKEGQTVKEDEVVAYIDNAADPGDVQELKDKAGSYWERLLSDSAWTAIADFEGKRFGPSLKIGELQTDYEKLITSVNKLKIEKVLDAGRKRIQSLQEEIVSYEHIEKKLFAQRDISEEEYDYAKRKFLMDSTLYSQKVIARLDMDNVIREMLPYKKGIEQIDLNILQNKVRRTQLSRELAASNMEVYETFHTLRNEIIGNVVNLINKIEIWESRYLFRSRYKGIVSFSRVLGNKEPVNVGDEVMNVVPDTKDIYGIALMNSQGVGKVKPGQKVKISLDGYPSNEYGTIRGTIRGISLVPSNQQYRVVIALPMGLETSFRKTIEPKPELTGSAEIVTQDLRLINRIFNQFLDLLNLQEE